MPRKVDNRKTMIEQVDKDIYMLRDVLSRYNNNPAAAKNYVEQRISDLTLARQQIYHQLNTEQEQAMLNKFVVGSRPEEMLPFTSDTGADLEKPLKKK